MDDDLGWATRDLEGSRTAMLRAIEAERSIGENLAQRRLHKAYPQPADAVVPGSGDTSLSLNEASLTAGDTASRWLSRTGFDGGPG
jgi:hypothetical protein